jgi:hypothetical protein
LRTDADKSAEFAQTDILCAPKHETAPIH